MSNLGIGIIGCGKHGSRYAGHLVRGDVPGLELVAVCRRSPEIMEQARIWHCQGYRNWQDLVDDPAVDAVILCLPPMANLAVVRRVVAARKPLLVEKPLAGTVQDAEIIVRLCSEQQVPLTVGQTLRYNQIVRLLRQDLPSWGHLFSFTAQQRLEPSTLPWHQMPEQAGAGVSFHTAVHVIDALCYITGLQVERVLASTHTKPGSPIEILLVVLVALENGVIGTLDCSKVGQARSGRLEFVCEQGQLIGDPIHNRLVRIRGMERSNVDPGPAVPTIAPLLADWRGFLRGEGENPVSGEEGLRAVRFCAACLRSAVSGTWTPVNPGPVHE